VVGHGSELKQVGRKKERGKKYKGAKLLLPLPLRVQGKKENSAIQNDIVLCFFFFEEKEINVGVTQK
jgi:hypothetical protein